MHLVQGSHLFAQGIPFVGIGFYFRQQMRKEKRQQANRQADAIANQQERFGVTRQYFCGFICKRALIHRLENDCVNIRKYKNGSGCTQHDYAPEPLEMPVQHRFDKVRLEQWPEQSAHGKPPVHEIVEMQHRRAAHCQAYTHHESKNADDNKKQENAGQKNRI